MFKESKYKTWYFNIMEHAKRNDSGDEVHHIIPKCLGGTDCPDNLVKLTFREHYIAHALLTKMHNSRKLVNAFWQMSFKNKNKYFNSKLYEYSRRSYVENISGDQHWSKSEKFKQSVSESWTDDRKQKFSEKVRGDKHWTRKVNMSEHASLMRQSIDHTKVIERSRMQMLNNNPMKNPEISKKFKGPKTKVTCPVCHKVGGKPVMMRYHFKNCKSK